MTAREDISRLFAEAKGGQVDIMKMFMALADRIDKAEGLAKRANDADFARAIGNSPNGFLR